MRGAMTRCECGGVYQDRFELEGHYCPPRRARLLHTLTKDQLIAEIKHRGTTLDIRTATRSDLIAELLRFDAAYFGQSIHYGGLHEDRVWFTTDDPQKAARLVERNGGELTAYPDAPTDAEALQAWRESIMPDFDREDCCGGTCDGGYAG